MTHASQTGHDRTVRHCLEPWPPSDLDGPLAGRGIDERRTDRVLEAETETGTTTLAIAGRDGVVLAADTRASLGGSFVTNRTARKIEPIGDRAAVAFSGSVSDAQAFVEHLRAETRLYELRHGNGRPIPIETLATLAGRLVRTGPYRVLDLLLAGVDEPAGTDHTAGETDDGLEAAVYDVGRGGAVLPTDYAASGSGMQLAYGALEGTVDSSLSVAQLRPIAANAVRSATARDTASGDGMTIATISRSETGGEPDRRTGVDVDFETYDLEAIRDVETGVESAADELEGHEESTPDESEQGRNGQRREGEEVN